MKTREMPGQTPETMSKREQYRKEYENIADRIFTTDDDETSYNLAQFDVYSEDTDKAMACFEVFDNPRSLYTIAQIIENTKNEEVKLELARRMDPVTDIKSTIEDLSDKNRDKTRDNTSLYAIYASRKAIEKMIEHSRGEARQLFVKKLREFENVVRAFNDAVNACEFKK